MSENRDLNGPTSMRITDEQLEMIASQAAHEDRQGRKLTLFCVTAKDVVDLCADLREARAGFRCKHGRKLTSCIGCDAEAEADLTRVMAERDGYKGALQELATYRCETCFCGGLAQGALDSVKT